MNKYILWENKYWKIEKLGRITWVLEVTNKKTGITTSPVIHAYSGNLVFESDIPQYIQKKVQHYFNIMKVLP
jgi:hypothetical protein